MSNHLPEPRKSQVPGRTGRAALTLKRAEVEIFNHEVRVAVNLQKEQIDSMAAGTAAWSCLDEELPPP